MKITKLSDDDACENKDVIPSEVEGSVKNLREISREARNDSEISCITKITAAVKTAGRYNIFINDKYSFSLDEAQLVKLGLKKGQEFSGDELAKLKDESDFGKNYIRAVDLISRRFRSEKEIRDYAWRKNWTKENIEKVIARLNERNYLDDEKFAKNFVSSRANLRNFSKRKMELELMKKGINQDIRERVLAENEDFDEADSLKRLIAKKRSHYENDQKLIAYLARQGFNYYDILNNLQ